MPRPHRRRSPRSRTTPAALTLCALAGLPISASAQSATPGFSTPPQTTAIAQLPDRPRQGVTSGGIRSDGTSLDSDRINALDASLLQQVKTIQKPGQRALALERIARSKTLSPDLKDLDDAHKALVEASQIVFGETDSLILDLRISQIVRALLGLNEALVREAMNDDTLRNVGGGEPQFRPVGDRLKLIDRARADWRLAADLAGRLHRPVYRSEALYLVAESESRESEAIAQDVRRAGSTRPDLRGQEEPLRGRADAMLVAAAEAAERIDRPTWRDRALDEVAAHGAVSSQFTRSIAVARRIPAPEARSDALIRIAESQARHGQPADATRTYQEAATTVAAIGVPDVRGILTGVLIDSLIAVGRFDDARAAIVLYPNETRKIVALWAIAESQGRRGVGDKARAWIAKDVAPEYRSLLYRRVIDGELSAIDQNRGQNDFDPARQFGNP